MAPDAMMQNLIMLPWAYRRKIHHIVKQKMALAKRVIRPGELDCSAKLDVVVPFLPSPFMGSPFPHYPAAVSPDHLSISMTAAAAGQFQILMAGISW